MLRMLTNSKHMQTEYQINAGECQEILLFAFLVHLEVYLGILQIFLPVFPVEF